MIHSVVFASVLKNETVEREQVCDSLKDFLAKVNREKEPFLTEYLEKHVKLCEGADVFGDAFEVYERTTTQLRVVGKDYSPEEDD